MKPLHKRILAKLSQEVWALPPDFLSLIHEIATERIEISADDAEKLRAMSEKSANGPIVPVVAEALPGRPSVIRVGDVGLMSVTGPIMRYADFFTEMSGGTSLEAINGDFSALESDPNVSSIIQVYDSPGGQATGVLETAEMFSRGQKPSTAYVEGMAASAAYALASSADRIVLGPMAEVGSVGVAAMVRTDKPKGRAEFVSSQTPRKRPDAGTDEGRREIQARVDALGQEFIAAVANMRGLESDVVAAWEGGVATGVRAINLGMADQRSVLTDLIFSSGDDMSKSKVNQVAPEPATSDNPAIEPEDQTQQVESRVVAAVSEERERTRACLKIAAPDLEGHLGKEIWAMLWDGQSSDGDMAKTVLAAERAQGAQVGQLPPPLALVPAADAAIGNKSSSNTKNPDTPEARWEKDPKLKDEFGTIEAYRAYLKAVDQGLITTAGNL